MEHILLHQLSTKSANLIDIWHLLTVTKTVSWDVESHLWWGRSWSSMGDAALKLGSQLCTELALELNFCPGSEFVAFPPCPFLGE